MLRFGRAIAFDSYDSGVDLRFEQPVWLWALALATPITLLGMRWLSAMSPARRWLSGAVRLTLVMLLVAMIAGLSSVRSSDALAVVGVVDVSGSVRRFYRGAESPGSPAGIDAAQRFFAEATRARGPDDLFGVVAFDGQAAAIIRPTRARDGGPNLDLRIADGTNIAEAIRLARAMIPPDAAGRLVLVSDGVQTAGDAAAAAAEAAGAGGRRTPIDVVPLTYALGEEVVVEALDAPPTAAMGSTATLRVAISASTPTTGTLQVLREGEPVDLDPDGPAMGRRISLRPGLNVERVEVRLDRGRVHRFVAVFEPDAVADPAGGTRPAGDTISENNRAEAFTVTPGRGSVLLVDGVSDADAGGAGATLANTLRDAGAEVTVLSPEAVPGDLLSLQAHDLIVLQNVAAERVPEDTQSLLRAYVEDLGGGLVMVGGPDSFAPGGWQGTPLEPILPVALDLPDVVMAPQAATVLVMDNSGSMWRLVLGTGRSQQEIANDAAALALRSLDVRDLVGVITFNSRHEVLVPLAKNTNPAETIRAVRSIGSGGGTNVIPALEAARDEIRRAAGDVKVRHVVVLSDGVSRGKDRIEALAREMNAEGIRVSAVAVGDGADLATMRRMASTGGGEYFHAASATSLPRLLLKAVRVVRTPLIREAPFTPVVLPTGSPIAQGLGTPPPLRGLVLTRPRPEPTVTLAMTTPGGEPVLAHWNAGLGQVAAWTSDASSWSTEWIQTDAFARLWSQIVRTIARAPETPGLRAESESGGETLVLRLIAEESDGGPMSDLSVPGTLYLPGGRQSPVSLVAVGPGVYEARVATPETGSYIALLKPARAGRPLSPVIVGSNVMEGAEFRVRRSDDELLSQIASRSGGRVLNIDAPAQANLFDRSAAPPREAVLPMWRTLLVWAIVMLILDIAMRRVAWDRWLGSRFRPEAALGAAMDRVRAASAAATAGTLRARVESLEPVEAPAIALSNEDARHLVEAARDRRRAERLANLRGDVGAPIVQETPPPSTDEPGEGGLLAAKRRARDRMDRE